MELIILAQQVVMVVQVVEELVDLDQVLLQLVDQVILPKPTLIKELMVVKVLKDVHHKMQAVVAVDLVLLVLLQAVQVQEELEVPV